MQRVLVILGVIVLAIFIPLILFVVFGSLLDAISPFIMKLWGKKKHVIYPNSKSIDEKSVPVFREIPCNKDLYYANALIYLNGFNYNAYNILGAAIVKWVSDDNIKIIKEENDSIKLDLNNNTVFTMGNQVEIQLFDILKKAAGENGILELQELKKYYRKNNIDLGIVLEKIKDMEIQAMKNCSYIVNSKGEGFSDCKYEVIDLVYEDSVKLCGLKKFLEEFSRIDSKETLDVKIWNEYLIFAYLFGIADKVLKQLKGVIPIEIENFITSNEVSNFINALYFNK